MITIEIMFDDLSEEKQNEILQEFETTPENENWDIYPIAYIEREETNEQE